MKSLLISQNGIERARVPLVQRSYLLGRSPSCDVVLRSKNMKPVHFLLEWLGEDEFKPEEGMWMLVDLSAMAGSQSDQTSGQTGDILSDSKTKKTNYEFSLFDDKLATTDVKRGVISRQLKQSESEMISLSAQSTVLEVVCYRSDLEAVVDVEHFRKNVIPEKSFQSLTGLKFVWDASKESLGFIESTGKSNTYQIQSRGIDFAPQLSSGEQKVQVTINDFFRIRSGTKEFFVRFVPKIEARILGRSLTEDAFLRSAATILVILLLFASWVKFSPAESTVNEEVIPPRVATVEVKELQTPPPQPKVSEPPPQPAENKVAEKPKQPREEKKSESAPPKEKMLPVAKEKIPAKEVTASAAPAVKNVSEHERPQKGLNSPAPIKNVNAVGLLGKLKSGGQKGTQVSADMVLNQGVVSDTATGETGFAVKKPPMGELGAGKLGGNSKNSPGLVAASTTLKNPGAANEKSVGPIGATGSSSIKSVGSSLGGKDSLIGKGSGSDGRLDALNDSGGVEATGGLTREDIRKSLAEHKRAIRNCYEIALLSKRDLEGKMNFKWKISPAGNVEIIDLTSSEFGMPSFEGCVKGVVQKVLFPRAPNGQPTIVKYPFVFQGKK